MRRSSAALVPLVFGLGWLTYKAQYLRMDAPPALQALIVSPALALLVASAFVAFPDARRRLAGTLVALGLIAAVWIALIARPQPGWTFYTPYSSMSFDEAWIAPKQSPISLVATTLLLPMGLALFWRRSPVGAALLGAAFWLFIGFPPELGELFRDQGTPRRYHYYYASEEQSQIDLGQKGVALVLTIGGTGLLARRRPDTTKGA